MFTSCFVSWMGSIAMAPAYVMTGERRMSHAPDKLKEMTQILSSQIKSIDDLRGPAGRLEALLNTGRADAAYAALVCHPHPHGGGTMHNKVVYHTMKAFSSFGLPVLRFNFRSVGLSEGIHDEGYGEQEDVQAALKWMEQNFILPIPFPASPFPSNLTL